MVLYEALVGAIISTVIENLASYLPQQFTRPDQEVVSELKQCRTKLLMIQKVVQDAENKQDAEDIVKEWLDDLQDLAYDLHDVVDELSSLEASQQLLKESRGGTNKKRKLSFSFPVITSYFATYGGDGCSSDLASHMNKINSELDQLIGRMHMLHLVEDVRIGRERFETTSVVDQSRIFGMNEKKDEMIDLLKEISVERVTVIPIVGMGGLGKTTLAQLVYNDQAVRTIFTQRIWVSVPYDYDIKKVTRTALNAITYCEYDDLNMLQNKLQEELVNKRFLLVLDDVWQWKHEDWDLLIRPFRVGSPGSKIIITTRNARVATATSLLQQYHLTTLTEADSLLLLAQHAFDVTSCMDDFPADFKQVAKKTVKRCGYLPLAVKTIGSTLRGNRLLEWEDALNNEIWDIGAGEGNDIIPALRLSYQHLPSPLKQCFAYCSLFPKNYEFYKDHLVRLWMAEGFLKQKKGRTSKKLEQIGGEYFEELLSRSFFEQSSTKIESFVMHDLMNDLARYVAGEFFFRWEKEFENFPEDKISRRVRHLSFSGREFDAFQRFTALGKASGLRTFLPFNRRYNFCFISQRVLSDILPKCLRTLSLSGYRIHALPDSIGNLKSLRYLNLSRTRLKSLPETIGSLSNLQTLDLSRSSVSVLPKGISNLTELRYLDNSDISVADDSKEMPSGMGRLTKLHKLPQVLISKRDDGLKLKELGKIPHLQGAFSIWKLRNVKNVEDAIDAKLKFKTGLDALELRWYTWENRNVDEDLEFNVLSALQPHKELSSFGIIGYGGASFPSWMLEPSFSKLKKFFLTDCSKSTSLPSLGQLPLLKDLCIQGMSELETIDCDFYGDGSPVKPHFPSLETLIFKNMPKWKNWNGGFHNMFPKLRLWCLDGCPNLENIPLILFPELEEIEFRNMPKWVEWSTFADMGENLNLFPSLRNLKFEKCRVELLINLINPSSSLTNLEMKSINDHTFSTYALNLGLSCLRMLRLENCSAELVRSLINLTSSLTDLELKSISKTTPRDSMLNFGLPSLHVLKLESCCEELVRSFTNLTSLTELEIDSTSWLTFQAHASDIGLPSLRKLELGKRADELSGSFSNLKLSTKVGCLGSMIMKGCILQTGRIPRSVRMLSISSGGLEPAASGLGLLLEDCSFSLQYLKISKWFSHMNLRALLSSTNHFARLIVLHISQCGSLQSFPDGGLHTPNLTCFAVIDCVNLKALPDQINTNKSIEVRIWSCPSLESFPRGNFCLELNFLDVMYCKNLKLLPNRMQTLTRLEYMKICGCPSLKSFPEEGNPGFVLPPNLKFLSINACQNLKPLTDLKLNKLTFLETFEVSDVYREIISFSRHGQAESLLPQSLLRLKISGLPKLESISEVIRNLTFLRHLDITFCRKLSSLPVEELSQKLWSLQIAHCPLLERWCEEKKRRQFIDYIPRVTFGPY